MSKNNIWPILLQHTNSSVVSLNATWIKVKLQMVWHWTSWCFLLWRKTRHPSGTIRFWPDSRMTADEDEHWRKSAGEVKRVHRSIFIRQHWTAQHRDYTMDGCLNHGSLVADMAFVRMKRSFFYSLRLLSHFISVSGASFQHNLSHFFSWRCRTFIVYCKYNTNGRGHGELLRITGDI